jgi:predicted nucleotidyltransferase
MVKSATPEQLARELADALPTQLKCVVLYGSAAAGDFVEGVSNYNLLAIIDPLGAKELDAVSSPVVEWNRRGYPTPLLFTRDQLAESADAFPIELLDIQQSRRILWGDDLLADIRIEPGNLQRQVQRDLIGKLLKLRGRYALTEGRQHIVTELMLRSLSTFLVLFRAALRLYQDTVPETKLDALRALARHIPFDIQPFERLFELKQLSGESRSTLPDVSFVSYLQAIECVTNAVNRRNTYLVGSKS